MPEFELKPHSIFDTVGGCRVEAANVVFDEAPARSLISLAARRGQGEALAKAVKKAFGIDLPSARQTAAAKGVTAIFAGPGQWFLSGSDEDLLSKVQKTAEGIGSVTDQSDGFTAVTLAGASAGDILMRLSSLDFHDDAFPVGAAARTPMQQISVMIVRTGAESYEMNTPRSTARDFAHDVKTAIEAVSAR